MATAATGTIAVMTDHQAHAPETPIPVFILSWERPLYLWASLDSLYRLTRHPHRFFLSDNASVDPAVRRVIRGFERRRMFEEVEYCCENRADRLRCMFAKWRPVMPEFFVFIESDVEVLTDDWLGVMWRRMRQQPKLGMLGSAIDAGDFVDPAFGRSIEPDMPQPQFEDMIKARSPERRAEPLPNPPGRLLMLRTATLDTVAVNRDSIWARNMREAGWEVDVAAEVRHRHLSLLNFYDYPAYDTTHRNAFFNAVNPDNRVI